jgi:hypothetical protein
MSKRSKKANSQSQLSAYSQYFSQDNIISLTSQKSESAPTQDWSPVNAQYQILECKEKQKKRPSLMSLFRRHKKKIFTSSEERELRVVKEKQTSAIHYQNRTI